MPSGVVHIGEGWPVGGRLGFFLGGPVRAPMRAARSFAHALTAAGSASSGVNNLRLSPDLGSRTMGGGDPFAESQRLETDPRFLAQRLFPLEIKGSNVSSTTQLPGSCPSRRPGSPRV